jgi:chemotaxis protein CheD
MYDATAGIGGMIHSLLPKSSGNNSSESTTAKFVDQGVPLLIDAVTKAGANRGRLDVYVCGGAQMLSAPGFKNSLNIGERNAEAAQRVLTAAGFRIKVQDTGGNSGRTVRLRVDTGEITVKTLGQGEKVLNPSLVKVR